MIRVTPVALAFVLAALGVSAEARAHSLLTNPTPLSQDDNAKSGPCGCYFGAGPEDPNDDATASKCPPNYATTQLVAGSKITVSWKETVNHAGSFRLAIAPVPVDGVVKADLDAHVVYEKPDANDTAGATVKAEITVPDTPCAACTLQLRQTMDGAPKPYYWSCAAIKIVPAGGSTSAATTGSTGSEGTSGAGGAGGAPPSPPGTGGVDDSTGAGMATPPPVFKTGACNAGGARGAEVAVPWLLLLPLLLRRRR